MDEIADGLKLSIECIEDKLTSTPYAFEQVTIDNTVGGKGLTVATYDASKKAIISVETAQIRYRVDGGAPTTTIGHVADIGDTIELESAEELVNFKAIRTGLSSGLISVSYFD